MKFEIVTLFPELIEVYKKNGIIGRAVENKLFELEYVFLRDYSQDKHKKVDDYPYGGGPGIFPNHRSWGCTSHNPLSRVY
jgi:tRNA (guanine37-N1)-methyltransferase